MNNFNFYSFQELIIKLQKFWYSKGCTIVQPLDIEVGAGTSHPITYLRALKTNPISVVYVQPSRRPIDGRYGNNPNRLQHYYQLQVIVKPSPDNIQELYLDSIKYIGLDINKNDISFIEDNWENPTLGAWGLGWEVWINGMEITQFTYFQQVGGIQCKPITIEITYGLERIAMIIQNVNSIYDIIWNKNSYNIITYGDLFLQNEIEKSIYNFQYADTDFLFIRFEQYEQEAWKLLNIKQPLLLPAYELALKAAHSFNMLESRKAISVSERKRYILRIFYITKKIAELYSIS